MKSKDLGNLCIWGTPGQGCLLLTMPKYLFFIDLILKTISFLTSDLVFRFAEGVIPLKAVNHPANFGGLQ